MKFGPKEIKELNEYLRTGRNRKREFLGGGITFASDLAKPVDKFEVQQIDLFNQFNKRNPRADGGRIGLLKGKTPKVQEMLDLITPVRQKYIDLKQAQINLPEGGTLKDFPNYEQFLIKEIDSVKNNQAEGKAEGGLMDLGGMEMDLRGGGFVPLGAKEKADDVPARLSKNEFVMTADAVRAAGGGSVDKGADKMYNLMKDLESRV